jgi:hypothetical protein
MIRKSNPSYTEVHYNRPLTNISVAHFQANTGKYIARRIFPAIPVQKKSDRYWVYDKGDLLRTQAGRRAPGTPADKGGYRISSDSYDCERWALGRNIADPERDNADAGIDLDGEASMFLTDQIELALEIEWATDFFTTSVWTGASSTSDMTGSANPSSTTANFRQWNDAASTPVEDIRGEMTSVESRTGFRPNRLVLGPRVWNALADHPDLLGRMGDNSARIFNRQMLANLLELDSVEVLNAVRTTSNEGQPDTANFIAGKHALLLYTQPNPGLRVPTAGYTFIWTGAGAPAQGSAMKRYRDEPIESDVIEAETWADFKTVSAELGAFFANAVS